MSTNQRILIIDDNLNLLDSIHDMLEEEGYFVDIAENGEIGIQKSYVCAYDLMLIDIHLPDMSGIEVLSNVKENIPKTRKIMLTGEPTYDNAVESLNKNADAYLTKGCDTEVLLRTIKEQIEKRESERKISQKSVNLYFDTRLTELEEQANQRAKVYRKLLKKE